MAGKVIAMEIKFVRELNFLAHLLVTYFPSKQLTFKTNKIGSGPKFNEHVLGSVGPVLDARVGRAAAVERDGGHEPADDRRTKSCKRQSETKESVRSPKSETNV